MIRKNGPHTLVIASVCTHPRRKQSTQLSWHLQSQCQLAGQCAKVWPHYRCPGCQLFSQWGAGSIDPRAMSHEGMGNGTAGSHSWLDSRVASRKAGVTGQKAHDGHHDRERQPSSQSDLCWTRQLSSPALYHQVEVRLGRLGTTVRLGNGLYGLTIQFGEQRVPIKPWRIASCGVKFDLSQKCDRRHDHGKLEDRETKVAQMCNNQIVDIVNKTVRRQMLVRFKESLSKLEETCSQCKHDQHSAKKIAVSIIEEINDIALDQQWLKRHVKGLSTIMNPNNSGLPLQQLRSPVARAAHLPLATPAQVR